MNCVGIRDQRRLDGNVPQRTTHIVHEPGLVCKGRLCSEVLLVISDGGVIWTVGVIIDSTSSQFLPSNYVSGSGDNHIDVCHATRDGVQPFVLYATD